MARNDTGRAAGPFPTRWYELKAYEQTRDSSPRSPLTGFYAAEVEFPEAGDWMVAATLEVDGGRAVGRGAVPVAAEVPAAVGSKAKALKTPVATTAAGRKKICTREPACPLHDISLDDALAAGRPTVVNFGTPLLCTSQICGPVVDEQMVVADKLGAKASFVHVEIYPSRNTGKPVPALTEYGFSTEPWLLVVDRDGVIRARYEGPVTAGQIEDALRPLLAGMNPRSSSATSRRVAELGGWRGLPLRIGRASGSRKRHQPVRDHPVAGQALVGLGQQPIGRG